MKKILVSTTALLFCLTFSTAAMANSDGASSYMEKAISKLPPDKAAEFHSAMKDAHEQNKELYEQMHALHQDLHNILTADTFDKDAFLAKSREMQQLHDKVAENLDMAFASAIEPLSPKDRNMLALAMTKQHHEKKAQKSQ